VWPAVFLLVLALPATAAAGVPAVAEIDGYVD
jgi:hypothetical protein